MLEAQHLNFRTLKSGKQPSRARGQAWGPSVDSTIISMTYTSTVLGLYFT